MEKKSSIKEVHKLVPQDYPELYKKLSSILGEDNPFAKFSIGAGIYIWSDNRCNWHQMIAWSTLKQEEVKEALIEVRTKLNALFGEKQTDLLLSVPDNSYIYFNDDKGEIKILITGWGFKKPVRIDSKPPIEEIVNKIPITLSFVYAGTRLPNYQFGIKLANKARKLHTDEDGICLMGNLCEGEKYTIYDIQNNNKTYNLEIIPNQTHYDIDLTKYAKVCVSAIADGQPVSNEQIDIQYHETSYNIITDTTGHATIDLPLHNGEQLSAKLRDQIKNINIQADDNLINFVFETTPPTPSVEETDILVSVIFDGNACPNTKVTIDYDGQTYSGVTNEKGLFIQHVQISEGKKCKVSVDEYTPQVKELINLPVNEFKFEETPIPIPQIPNKVTPKLIVQREDGEVVGKYPIIVEVDSQRNSYLTDRDGEIILPEMNEKEIMTVIDGDNPQHTEEYVVNLEQKEYIFTISDEDIPLEQKLKLMFRDKEGKPISYCGVKLHQDGREDVNIILDENGNTYLPKETFKTKKKITASINGWENKYTPIPFEIDENEYEYLLQEKESTNSWWMIFLQILAVLAAITVATILWPFIEGVCIGLFERIYS